MKKPPRTLASSLVYRIVPLGHWGENGRRVTTGYRIDRAGLSAPSLDFEGEVNVARFDTLAEARAALAAVDPAFVDDELKGVAA